MSLLKLSPACSEYCSRLVQLHDYIQRDDDESVQAEELREEMDAFWRDMTPEEVTFADALSTDLYFVLEAPLEDHDFDPGETAAIEAAMVAGSPLSVIEELRRHRERLSPAVFAAFQAICWKQLGLPQIADRFFKSAKHRNPEMAEFAERIAPFVCSIVAKV